MSLIQQATSKRSSAKALTTLGCNKAKVWLLNLRILPLFINYIDITSAD